MHFILEEQSKPGEVCVCIYLGDGMTDWELHDMQQVPYASRLENKINLGFGRKSIERILVIPQVSKAVVLCGNDHVLGRWKYM